MAAPDPTRPAPVVSVSPVVLPAPDRGTDLRLRVSAPVTGGPLPVVVLSHGLGQSGDGYLPLAHHWASHGFVVVQPTHLDSPALGPAPDDPRTPGIWRTRVEDLRRTVDRLDVLEAAVPGLAGRVDRDRVAVAGHSWGAQSAGMLLGARVLDADGRLGEDLSDPRVRAGVLLSAPGTGGSDLSPFAVEHFPFLGSSFATLTTPTLVVAGDHDDTPLSTRGPDWATDAYRLGPGADALLTVHGGEHFLGGVAGAGLAATTDEDPRRVALVREVTAAWLRSALTPGDPSWAAASAPLRDGGPLGRVDVRPRG